MGVKKYYFKPVAKRVLGFLNFFVLAFSIGVLVYQATRSSSSDELVPLVILVMFALLVTWHFWVQDLKVAMTGDIALELHEKHLVIASEAGVLTIPKEAIVGIPKLDSMPFQQLYLEPRVSVAVLPEYQIPRWYGYRGNPSFPAFLVEGHSQYQILSDLSHWLAAN